MQIINCCQDCLDLRLQRLLEEELPSPSSGGEEEEVDGVEITGAERQHNVRQKYNKRTEEKEN